MQHVKIGTREYYGMNGGWGERTPDGVVVVSEQVADLLNALCPEREWTDEAMAHPWRVSDAPDEFETWRILYEMNDEMASVIEVCSGVEREAADYIVELHNRAFTV